MYTQAIQAEIDSLRERLKNETAIYKQAIADQKSFEEVKTLYTIVKNTLEELFNTIERYGQAIDDNAPKKIKNKG